MLIMAIHQVPSLTQERYEEVIRRLTNGKRRLESLSDLPFQGLLVHFAGPGKNGFCIVDVFESEDGRPLQPRYGLDPARGRYRRTAGVLPGPHVYFRMIVPSASTGTEAQIQRNTLGQKEPDG